MLVGVVPGFFCRLTDPYLFHAETRRSAETQRNTSFPWHCMRVILYFTSLAPAIGHTREGFPLPILFVGQDGPYRK